MQIREVRRFREEWERAASLKLRACDVSVIEEYKQHGRIYDGRRDDMFDRAVRNWLGDVLAGRIQDPLCLHQPATRIAWAAALGTGSGPQYHPFDPSGKLDGRLDLLGCWPTSASRPSSACWPTSPHGPGFASGGRGRSR